MKTSDRTTVPRILQNLCQELATEDACHPFSAMCSEVRCVLDSQGELCQASGNWEELTGVSWRPGLPLRQCVVEKDRHILQAFMNGAAGEPGRRHERRVRLAHPRERERWARVVIQAVQDPETGGQTSAGYIVVLSAVDELVRLERRNQEQDDLGLKALQAAGRGLFVLDLSGGALTVDGDLLGSQSRIPEDFEALLDMVHVDDRHGLKAAVNAHLRDADSPLAFEFRVLAENGDWVWRMLSGQVVERDGAGYPMKIAGIISDISSRKSAEQKLKLSENRLRSILADSPVGVAVADAQGRILFCNERLAEMRNLPQSMMKGRNLCSFYAKPERWEKHLAEFRTHGCLEGAKAVWGLHGRDKRWVLMTWNRFVFSGAEAILCWVYDITELTRAERKLKELATTDHLTRLFNRRFFMLLAGRELKRAKRYNLPLSLLMFDADKFKKVNDTYGHAAGDRVLVNLAETARTTLRDVDILARIGGEEFAVILPETGGKSALLVAERLRAVIQDSRVDFEGQDIGCTVSIGVSSLDAETESVEQLMVQADLALFEAKDTGRNRVVVATDNEDRQSQTMRMEYVDQADMA